MVKTGLPENSMLGIGNDQQDVLVLDIKPGEDVVLDGPWFLKADFDRQGGDLVIEGPDGEKVIVTDYFDQPNPPDITTSDGVKLNGETATVLAGPRVDGAFAQAQELAQVQPIGTIETLEGGVEVTRADGTIVVLQIGDAVYQGDVIETADGAAVGIVFADESTFALGEEGRMVLDEMIYDPGEQEGQAAISLLQGAFTFVSGQIAKTGVDAMVIETPTATIGIRGTAGGGNVNGAGQITIALANERGQIVGEVTISTDTGSQTINQAFQAISVASRASNPSEPFTITARQFGQAFGDAAKNLPGVRETLPAEVFEEIEKAVEEQQAVKQQAEQAAQESAQKAAEADAAAQNEVAAKAEAESAANDAVKAEEAAQAAAEAAASATTAEEQAAAQAAAEAADAAADAAALKAAEAELTAAEVGVKAATLKAEAATAAKVAAKVEAEAVEVSADVAVVTASKAQGVATFLDDVVAAKVDQAQKQVADAEASETKAKEDVVEKQKVVDKEMSDVSAHGTH